VSKQQEYGQTQRAHFAALEDEARMQNHAAAMQVVPRARTASAELSDSDGDDAEPDINGRKRTKLLLFNQASPKRRIK
jgi:hypothetical protein